MKNPLPNLGLPEFFGDTLPPVADQRDRLDRINTAQTVIIGAFVQSAPSPDFISEVETEIQQALEEDIAA